MKILAAAAPALALEAYLATGYAERAKMIWAAIERSGRHPKGTPAPVESMQNQSLDFAGAASYPDSTAAHVAGAFADMPERIRRILSGRMEVLPGSGEVAIDPRASDDLAGGLAGAYLEMREEAGKAKYWIVSEWAKHTFGDETGQRQRQVAALMALAFGMAILAERAAEATKGTLKAKVPKRRA